MAIAICRGDWMSALPKDAVMLHLRSVCLNDSDEWRSAMAEGHWSGRMWSTRLERSYTPPTCRLTVVGRRSLWSSRQRPRLLNVRFELRLDDPRLPDQDQKRVSGDQAQLFHLSQLVCSYVQGVLSQSHEYLEALSSPLTPSYGTEGQRGAMTQPVGTTIAAISPPRAATYMEPQGLTAHNLVLGTLATPDSGPVIRLGTLQLFDVLCALESFLTDWESWWGQNPEKDGLPGWLSPLVGLVATGGLVVALAPLAENPPSQDPTSSSPSATLNPWDSLGDVFGQTMLGSLNAQSLAPPETRLTPPPPAIAELPPLSQGTAPLQIGSLPSILPHPAKPCPLPLQGPVRLPVCLGPPLMAPESRIYCLNNPCLDPKRLLGLISPKFLSQNPLCLLPVPMGWGMTGRRCLM